MDPISKFYNDIMDIIAYARDNGNISEDAEIMLIQNITEAKENLEIK